MRYRIALLLALAAICSVAAHERHDAEPGRPTYTEVEVGGIMYRVGLAYLPHDPLVGETVRIEARFAELPAQHASTDVEGRLLTDRLVRLQIAAVDRSSAVTIQTTRTSTPGAALGTIRFDRPGAYVVSASVDAERGPVSAMFPLVVAAGPRPHRSRMRPRELDSGWAGGSGGTTIEHRGSAPLRTSRGLSCILTVCLSPERNSPCSSTAPSATWSLSW